MTTTINAKQPKKITRRHFMTLTGISEAVRDHVILAHRFFGKQLPKAHGAPLRARVPDRYFYKSVKWLEGIRFSEVDEPGFYESRGYSNSADPWKEERFQ